MKARILLGASLVALALPALAATGVKDVKVTADITAIQNPAAAQYWSNIAADLQDAIAARLVDQIDPAGAEVTIDIDELSLTNSFASKLGMQDAVLSGQVNVSSETDNSDFDAYKLTVTSQGAMAFAEDGTPLTAAFTDTPEYYKAIVRAFADEVAQKLK